MAEQAANTTPRAEGRRPRSPRGGRRDDRRNVRDDAPKEFEELVINIVFVGNRKDKVGVGVAKGADVQAAVAKATSVAKKHLITLPLNGETIPHDSEVKFSGARVLIKPAAPGTGIIAGGVVRQIIGVTGIRNLLTKSLGSTNKVNIAYATIEALKSLVPRDQWLSAQPVRKVAKKEAK